MKKSLNRFRLGKGVTAVTDHVAAVLLAVKLRRENGYTFFKTMGVEP